MIVSIVPHVDFSPVPRVEILLEETLLYDGGDAEDTGGGELDGGDAGDTGAGLDAGTAATVLVDVPAGTDRITVWRRSEGRQLKSRGAVDRVFTGTLGFLDVEAGHDVSSTYELECWDGDVSLGRVALGSITLPWAAAPNGVLIQQPLNPNLSVVAMNLEGSWPSLTNDAGGDIVHTEGNTYPVLVGSGPRRAYQGVALDFSVATREDAEKLKATLGTEENPQLQVWLIRAHQGFLPRVFFCHVKELTEVDINLRHRGEWTRFQAVVDEIAPPAPALVIAPLSYDDLDVTFDDYDDMDAAFPSYAARDTAWDLAGAAG